MIQFARKYTKTILFFAIVGLIGGFFTGLYILEMYPDEIRQQLINELDAMGLSQIPHSVILGLITAVQSAGYGLFFGIFGIIISKKIGLWKDERSLTLKPMIATIVISILCGLLLIYPDLFFFGKYSDVIMDSYATKPSIPYILASVTYGAVIEEVMMRLFFMSLIALILNKLFGDEDKPTAKILIVSNVISALLFAAGHLPINLTTIGSSPLIIFRCFLLNGIGGILFGYLYRKYGLRYAMLAHGGAHIVSKLIWILFI